MLFREWSMNNKESVAAQTPGTQSPLNSLTRGGGYNTHLNTYSSSISSSSATASLSHGGYGTNSLNTMNSNQSHLTAPSDSALNRSLSNANDKQKKKIGHREVKDGVVHYKKISTNELKKSIQFGIVHFLNENNRTNMDRDLLMQDFQVIDVIQYPK